LIANVAGLCLQLLFGRVLPPLLARLHQRRGHAGFGLIGRETRQAQRLCAVHHDRAIGRHVPVEEAAVGTRLLDLPVLIVE
jgi:hypothetical protein